MSSALVELLMVPITNILIWDRSRASLHFVRLSLFSSFSMLCLFPRVFSFYSCNRHCEYVLGIDLPQITVVQVRRVARHISAGSNGSCRYVLNSDPLVERSQTWRTGYPT